jgi:hypothetical protein
MGDKSGWMVVQERVCFGPRHEARMGNRPGCAQRLGVGERWGGIELCSGPGRRGRRRRAVGNAVATSPGEIGPGAAVVRDFVAFAKPVTAQTNVKILHCESASMC